MPDDRDFIGHIRIEPALNEAERAYLHGLVESAGTLRGTPTGRGDRDVPFAHLGWEVCSGGCCLRWNTYLERSAMMLPSLRFLIDHLLRSGAKAEGRAAFAEFTFDHVVDGIVMGRHHEEDLRVVEVVGNAVSERVVARLCGHLQERTRVTSPRRRSRRLPANVIEFRPRRA